MRRIFTLSVLCLAAGVVSACDPDKIIPTEDIPTAGVRFINAVPDTMRLDFRFVDIVESNAHFRTEFRNTIPTGAVPASTAVQYKNTRAGNRPYRIFLNDTIQTVASTVINEGTMTVEAGKLYTVLLWGYANPSGALAPAGAPPMRVDIYEETVANPGTQVALRVINATRNTIDANFRPLAGTFGPTPAAWNDIAPLTRSSFELTSPDTIIFRVQDGGGAATLFADTRALVGIPANSSGATDEDGVLLPCGGPGQLKCDIEASPGTTIAGSAVTAIVFPGSVACTASPQTSAFQFTTGFRNDLSVNAAGQFARAAGSFVTDAIPVGSIVGVCGFTQAENNGQFTVNARTATTLTVTKVGGGTPVLEAGTTGNTTGNISATATGYARATGSFITNGFVPGMLISATGFTQAANNGTSTVTAVTATTLTVTKTPQTVLEAATTGTTTLGATATGYSRSTGSFVADGWVVGQPITASGFVNPENNGASTVSAVTATALTVTKIGGTVAEAELPGRVISSSATRVIANAGLRLIAAERPAISFIWDRRPPRPF